jgi:hypothetical protein
MEGAFSSKDNSIVVLQRRGVVFTACHNTIWELAESLAASGRNPDHLTVDKIAAELSNHLIPDVVLTLRRRHPREPSASGLRVLPVRISW